MSTRIRNDAQRWFLGVALTYCAVIFAGGHAALFLGLLVPMFWVKIATGDAVRWRGPRVRALCVLSAIG